MVYVFAQLNHLQLVAKIRWIKFVQDFVWDSIQCAGLSCLKKVTIYTEIKACKAFYLSF